MDKIEKVLELSKMVENGLLSKEEFMTMKKSIMESSDSSSTNRLCTDRSKIEIFMPKPFITMLYIRCTEQMRKNELEKFAKRNDFDYSTVERIATEKANDFGYIK